jgi:hypothetical protein
MSADSSVNRAAAAYTSFPWLPEQQFAMHRTEWADCETVYARVPADRVPLKKLSEKVAPLAKD